MKNSIKLLVLTTISLVFIITSCSKENASSKDDDIIKSVENTEADLVLEGDGSFEKVITKPLVKIDDCKFIVEGTIEFRKGDQVVAIIDFGDGQCDDIATKTVGDNIFEFSLKKYGLMGKYEKVIVEPIVKIEDCKYIVSGIVDFYQGDKWVATIDFGDGECDEWATKTWDGGSKVFSMNKI